MREKVKEVAAQMIEAISKALHDGGEWTSGVKQVNGFRLPRNAATGARYKGINAVSLWMIQQERGYWSNKWMTFRQKCALEAKLQKELRIRAGEKASIGLKVADYVPKEFVVEGSGYRSSRTGELVGADEAKRKFWRPFAVFNAAQFELLPEEIDAPPADRPPEPHTVEMCAFFDSLGPKIVSSLQPGYRYIADEIDMPGRSLFTSDVHYCSTLGHEMVHWTGHKSRCDRELIGATGSAEGMSNPKYAFEELVAELGSLLLCIEFNVPPSMTHALYAAHFTKYLELWPEQVVSAASKADQAVRWMLKKGGLLDDSDTGEAGAISRAA